MAKVFDCIKLFHEKSHAEQFMRGDLRFTRVKTYIDIEGQGEGIQDEYEGLVRLDRPYTPMLDIGHIERVVTGNSDIPSRFEPVASPISTLTFKGCEQSFVLCSTDIYEALESKESYEEQRKSNPKLSEDYLRFAKGYKYAVFFNSVEISDKLTVYAKENNLVFHNYMVTYSDEGSSPAESGNALAMKCIYVKPTKFEYEHEYRYTLMLDSQRIENGDTIVSDKKTDHFYAHIGAIHSFDFPIEMLWFWKGYDLDYVIKELDL